MSYNDIRTTEPPFPTPVSQAPCAFGPLCPYCEIDRVQARLAEMRQAMDELHIKHGRSMRRLAEAERLLADIVDDAAFMACRCGAPTCRTTIVRNFLRPADSADEVQP